MSSFSPWRDNSRREESSSDSPNRTYSSLRKNSNSTEDFQPTLLTYPPPLNTKTPLRPHFGTTDRLTGYLTIILCFVSAIIVAVLNHVAFSQLNGTPTGGHSRQFWVNTLKTTLPAAVALILFITLKHCLSQAALYRIRVGSHPLALVNLMTSSPSALNIFLILMRSSMRLAVLWFVVLASITQGVALVSIFLPGTLTVTDTAPFNTSLQIPTIDFNQIDPLASSYVAAETSDPPTLSFVESSQRWRQLITRAASDHIAPTWNPPAGCGTACSYKFQYAAPAVNCTELSRQDIWPSGRTNDSRSLLAFPLDTSDPNETLNEYFFYNSSFAFNPGPIDTPNVSVSTLDVYYMEGFNTTLDQVTRLGSDFPKPLEYNPRGAHCEFVNATYEATTSFLNNTQSSSTRVVELGGFLPIGHDADGPYAGTNTTNATLAFRSIAQSFAQILRGNAFYQANSSGLVTDSTQALNTPIFNLSSVLTSSTDDSESAITVFFFSLSRDFEGSLPSGVQRLLGNVTLAFVNEQMAFTAADVAVTPGTTQYQYNAKRLGLIYGLVFGLSLVVVVHGLACLWANGTTAVFDLEHIIEMTAGSSGLHASALRPRFGSTPVKGELYADGGSTRAVLDVNTDRKGT